MASNYVPPGMKVRPTITAIPMLFILPLTHNQTHAPVLTAGGAAERERPPGNGSLPPARPAGRRPHQRW